MSAVTREHGTVNRTIGALMRRSWTVLLLTLCTSANAGILPEAQREDLVKRVLENFWGRAKLSNGQVAQPASEAERTTIPVSKAVVNRALDAGEISGLAEWCKVDWRAHYLSLTRAARAKGLNDKQVAFVSFLHGAAQGNIASAMAKSTCQDQERKRVQQMLDQSTPKGLDL